MVGCETDQVYGSGPDGRASPGGTWIRPAVDAVTSEPSDSRVPAAPAPARWWASRALYVALGWTCVAVGAIGVVVPLLPTTIFMIVALWAFGRGSSRFRAWLYDHPRFGPPLHAWREHRAIAPSAKLAAVATMLASLAVILASTNDALLTAGVGLVLLPVAVYLLSRPSR